MKTIYASFLIIILLFCSVVQTIGGQSGNNQSAISTSSSVISPESSMYTDSTIRLIMIDQTIGADTIYFGYHVEATRCIDLSLGEYSLPPIPPAGFREFRFTDPRLPFSDCYDKGTRLDLRSQKSITNIDTFRIYFQSDDYPITISWDSSTILSHYHNSVVMFAPGYTEPIDMKSTNSVNINQSTYHVATIIANHHHTSSISGNLFNDLNYSTIHDSDEQLLPQWKVFLSGKIQDTVLTDSNGNYVFSEIDSGSYSISIEPIAHSTVTAPENGTYLINLPENYLSTNNDFGVHVYPQVSIHDIQYVPYDSLLLADQIQSTNSSRWMLQAAERVKTVSTYDDTVTVIGLCVIPPKVVNYTAQGFTMVVYDTGVGNTPWSGIFVRCNSPVDTLQNIEDGFLNVKKGDIVRMIGRLSEFPISSMNSLTQIQPIPGIKIDVLDSNWSIPPPVLLGDSVEKVYLGTYFPSGPFNVHYSTCEQYESMIIKFTNLTVTSNSPIGERTIFDMINARGSSVGAFDMTNSNTQVPPIGSELASIQGLLVTRAGGFQNRGYILGYNENDNIVIALPTPIIASHMRSPIIVQESIPFTISVNVEPAPFPSYPIDSVYCMVSVNYGPYIKSIMNKSIIGNTYTTAYSGLSSGDIVHYFIQAFDTYEQSTILAYQNDNSTYNDTALGVFNFTVLNNPPTIYDIQYTTNRDGGSRYTGATVTLHGIVTADSNDLMTTGFTNYDTHAYYIQSSSMPWNGIWLTVGDGDSTLGKVHRGDSISVTGVVSENGLVTHLNSIVNTATILSSGKPVPTAIPLPTGTFAPGSLLAEQYEGMLITISSSRITSVNPYFSDPRIYSVDDGSNDLYIGANGKNTYSNLPEDIQIGRYHTLYEGDTIDTMTGIIYFNRSPNRYILCPRTDEDILAGGHISYAPHWNLVSIGREQKPSPAGYKTSTLFSSAITQAFKFEGSYSSDSIIEIGRGYWLKFPEKVTYRRTGLKILTDTIPLAQGWNLIGMIGDTINTSNAVLFPIGNYLSEFYGYNNGYYTTSTLIPGMGYWVKANQPGYLILSSVTRNLSSHNKIRIVHSNELPPPPPGGSEYIADVLPGQYALEQNYPNPFNGITTIRYQIPDDGATRNFVPVTLSIYNVLGQQIATLVNEVQPAGFMSVTWDAGALPTGIYYYKLQAGDFTDTKKLLLMK